jgi:hypothetical protein
MLARNRGDAAMTATLRIKLAEAQGALAAAEGRQARMHKAVSNKEAHKRWLKF